MATVAATTAVTVGDGVNSGRGSGDGGRRCCSDGLLLCKSATTTPASAGKYNRGSVVGERD
jgi:hypothetical protein